MIQEIAAGKGIILLYGRSDIAWDVLCRALLAISQSRLVNLSD